METGTHSPWVSRLVSSLGHAVIVANARKLRAISQSQTKSDEEDAEMLARLGRADPKLLSPVRHRSEATQRALVRLKVREALGITKAGHVQLRCLLVNCAHYILAPFAPPCRLRAAGERIAADRHGPSSG